MDNNGQTAMSFLVSTLFDSWIGRSDLLSAPVTAAAVPLHRGSAFSRSTPF